MWARRYQLEAGLDSPSILAVLEVKGGWNFLM